MLSTNQYLSSLIFEIAQQRYDAQAIKLVTDESIVPQSAYRPFEQSQRHIALCRAFAITRRENRSVYMRKEDHWCWAPLIAFGAVECKRGQDSFKIICENIGIQNQESAARFVENMARVPYEKYKGILCAPLAAADFDPDVILINCKNDELRTILLAIKSQTGTLLRSDFDAIDSCIWSIIPPMDNAEYRITLPDPGDYSRALTDQTDIILSIPWQRIEEFTKGMELNRSHEWTTSSFIMDMKNDFPRPPFYNELYRLWSLPEGETWKKQ